MGVNLSNSFYNCNLLFPPWHVGSAEPSLLENIEDTLVKTIALCQRNSHSLDQQQREVRQSKMCHQNLPRPLCLLKLCFMWLLLSPSIGYWSVQAVIVCLSLCFPCSTSGFGAIRVQSSVMRVKHKAKFRSEGETMAFPPFQLQMEVGHRCQSGTAEALWALSQLPVAQSYCCCHCGCRAVHSPWIECQPRLWGGR